MLATWLGSFYQRGISSWFLCVWVATAHWVFPFPRILLVWLPHPYFLPDYLPISILLNQIQMTKFYRLQEHYPTALILAYSLSMKQIGQLCVYVYSLMMSVCVHACVNKCMHVHVCGDQRSVVFSFKPYSFSFLQRFIYIYFMCMIFFSAACILVHCMHAMPGAHGDQRGSQVFLLLLLFFVMLQGKWT